MLRSLIRFFIPILFFVSFSGQLAGQITASFTANTTGDCAPFLVSFSNQSVSASPINFHQWSIEGFTYNVANPSHVFDNPGCFEICLIVGNTNNQFDTICVDSFICAFADPIADFSSDIITGCDPLTVTFEDLSVLGSGVITSYSWNFGDGNVSTDPNPVHTFNHSASGGTGLFTVTLQIEDANGCTSFIILNDYIDVIPAPEVVFDFSIQPFCDVPVTVGFNNLSNNPATTQYTWNYGDSPASETAFSPSHVYTDYGDYTVTVFAIDPVTGCNNFETFTDIISIPSPLEIGISPSSGCKPDEITFSQLITAGNNVVSQTWDFGDGSPLTGQVNPTHVYDSTGCFTVTLTAELANGCIVNIVSDTCVNIEDSPDFNYTVNGSLAVCSPPHTLTFDGISTNAASWNWDFGTAGSFNVEDPTVTFNDYGLYPINVTLISASGCETTVAVDTVRILEPVADFSPNTNEGCAEPLLNVFFTDNSTAAGNIVSWNWNFGNGFTSTSAIPSVAYADTGCYDVTLIVTDNFGCTDTITKEDEICAGMYQTVNFGATPTSGCVESAIEFTDSSDISTSWLWLFGDGGTSENPSPNYYYQDTGVFDVTLFAFHYGCPSLVTFDNYISIATPIAKYDFFRTCSDPFTVNFVDNSIGAETWFWDFGDTMTLGDTASMVTNTTYTFPGPGVYSVSLSVYNAGTDCTHTRVKQIIIANPIANFDVDTTFGCVPLTIQTADFSQDAINYSWSSTYGDITLIDSTNDISVVYDSAGIFNDLFLIIEDTLGCFDTIGLPSPIQVSGVEAGFTMLPFTGCAPLTVNFTDTSTSFLGLIDYWNWNFGDSSPNENIQNPSHLYGITGSYDVELSISNNFGCVDTMIQVAAVIPTFPTPSFDVDTFACTGQVLEFDNLSIGTNLDFLWTFGDGNSGTLVDEQYAYSSEDTFTVCLYATDVNGCSDSTCQTIVVVDPVVDFTQDTTEASCPPLVVQFFDSSSNVISWDWDFGNGVGSNVPNPTTVYPNAGFFEVSLIGTSISGCKDTLTIDSLIQLDGPVADIWSTDFSGCSPFTLNFYATGLDVDTYTFLFGDGNSVVIPSTGNGDTVVVQHTYNDTFGTYIPELLVQDLFGCQKFYQSDSVEVRALDFEIISDRTIVCDSGFVSFSPNIILNSSSNFSVIQWIFEGGTPDTVLSQFTPQIFYNSVGTFDVSLILDNGFCFDTITQPDFIEVVVNPIAGFTTDVDEGCPALQVSFTDSSFINGGIIVNYDWDLGNGITEINPSFVSIYDTAGLFQARLIVTSDKGCSDTISTEIEVFSIPEFNIDEYDEVCPGDSVLISPNYISDTTGYTFLWTPSGDIDCSTCPFPTVYPSSTTEYTLFVTNSNGCMDSTTVLVPINPIPPPVLTITQDSFICPGTSVPLFVGDNQNLGVFAFQWDESRPGLNAYDNLRNPIASPSETTTYVVTVTNNSGCSTTDSVTIFVYDGIIDRLDDRVICRGDTVELSPIGMTVSEWFPGSGLSCVFCQTTQAFPIFTTEYVYTAISDTGNCQLVDTVLVTVLGPEHIDAGGEIEICLGDSLQLNAIGPGDVSWSPNTFMSNDSILNPVVAPDSVITYVLTITEDLCSIQDSVIVTPHLSAEIMASDTGHCPGDSVQLLVEGNANTFVWSPSEFLNDPNIENPISFVDQTTTFKVVGYLGSCPADSVEVTVQVYDPPVLFMDREKNFFFGQGVQLLVEAEGDGPFEYNWSPFSGINCFTCPNPISAPDTNKTYQIAVTDVHGCITEDSVQLVLISDCGENLIKVPNAFSPNGDGQNDLLRVRGSSLNEIVTFRVFDRWGELLFESNDLNDGWDGTYQGLPVNPGVYVYYVEAPCAKDGTIRMFKKGNVTLLR